METWQVLEKAAALIEERGWTQGALSEGAGEVCALGAIGFVLNVPRDSEGDFDYFALRGSPVVRALSEHLRRTIEPTRARIGIWDWCAPLSAETRVYAWNDSYATDASEVVDTLRRVAQAEWQQVEGMTHA